MNTATFNEPSRQRGLSGINPFQGGYGAHKSVKDYDRKNIKQQTQGEFEEYLKEALEEKRTKEMQNIDSLMNQFEQAQNIPASSRTTIVSNFSDSA